MAIMLACAGEKEAVTQDGSGSPTSTPATGEPGAEEASADVGTEIKPEGVTTPTATPKPPVVVPDFGPGMHGLRLSRSIVVRATPDLEGEKLGTVAAHTVVGWSQAVKAPGCDQRWIEIAPRGWVCEGYLEPVSQGPGGVELPKLGVGERVPGTYGKVFGQDALLVDIKDGVVVGGTPIVGSSTVRQRGTAVVADVVYWKIDGGKYVAETSLRPHKPSSFRGSRLQGGLSLDTPLGFAFSGERPGDWVVVRDKPGGKRVRRLAPRSLVPVLATEKSSDGKVLAYRIGEEEFVAKGDMRLVEIQEPPPLTLPDERWFDVDLDSQVLVAYEGALPVYTTLISSGTRKNPTETGIFRIWIKFSETSMSGRMGESDAYSVATVPWTQFYENDFALHTSYWHDRFGQKRSHGCVNLSPRDSRFLYFWSEPQVPRGWSMANASKARPGSMVRVRSSNDPNPEFKGEAAKVQRAREEG